MLWRNSCSHFFSTTKQIMEEKKKNGDPKKENLQADYNPTDRDIQRTDEDIDSISVSEKEDNERTERGNTKPDKDKVW
jgi:hypothetical protein